MKSCTSQIVGIIESDIFIIAGLKNVEEAFSFLGEASYEGGAGLHDLIFEVRRDYIEGGSPRRLFEKLN